MSVALKYLRSAAILFGFASSSVWGNPEIPDFVGASVHSSNTAVVLSSHSSLKADFLIASGGAMSGFDRGVVANVSRAGRNFAEVIIVEVTFDRAVALILNLDPAHGILPGDQLRIRTL